MTYSFVGVEDVYVPIAVVIVESRGDGSCSAEMPWCPERLELCPSDPPLSAAGLQQTPSPRILTWHMLALFLAVFPSCLQEMGALVKLR